MRINIKRMRDLLASGTQGKWEDTGADHAAYVEDSNGEIIADCGDGSGLDNAALIAEVHNALPALLDELERWRAIEETADELDRASVVLGASINPNSKRRFFDAIGAMCDAVETVRKAAQP